MGEEAPTTAGAGDGQKYFDEDGKEITKSAWKKLQKGKGKKKKETPPEWKKAESAGGTGGDGGKKKKDDKPKKAAAASAEVETPPQEPFVNPTPKGQKKRFVED
jgi:hypothetical protein